MNQLHRTYKGLNWAAAAVMLLQPSASKTQCLRLTAALFCSKIEH